MLFYYISYKLKMSQMSQINIHWYVVNVSLSWSTPDECLSSPISEINEGLWSSSAVHRRLTTNGRLNSTNLNSRRKQMLGLCRIHIFVSKQNSTRAGSDATKICRRYSEDVQATTGILKCNIIVYVEIIIIILILYYEYQFHF